MHAHSRGKEGCWPPTHVYHEEPPGPLANLPEPQTGLVQCAPPRSQGQTRLVCVSACLLPSPLQAGPRASCLPTKAGMCSRV